jgi:diacylglycerol kinase
VVQNKTGPKLEVQNKNIYAKPYMLNPKRLLKSFQYSLKGLFKTFREESNLRIQTIIGIIIVVAGCLLKIQIWEWVAIIFVIGLVIITELINSAVERITDVLKPRINGYVKEIKDIMAAAVFVSALVAVIIGLIIFLPYIL